MVCVQTWVDVVEAVDYYQILKPVTLRFMEKTYNK